MSAQIGNGKGKIVPLGFGGLSAKVGDHIGHFYQTREDMKYERLWRIQESK